MESESEEEVIVVAKKKTVKAVKAVKAVKKSKKLIIETTDSEGELDKEDYDSESSEEAIVHKSFGKTHQNKKSIVKIHQPPIPARDYKKALMNTDDFFC